MAASHINNFLDMIFLSCPKNDSIFVCPKVREVGEQIKQDGKITNVGEQKHMPHMANGNQRFKVLSIFLLDACFVSIDNYAHESP